MSSSTTGVPSSDAAKSRYSEATAVRPNIVIDCRPVRDPISGVARYCIELMRYAEISTKFAMTALVREAGNQEYLSQLPGDHYDLARKVRPPRIRNAMIEFGPNVRSRKLAPQLLHETYFARVGLIPKAPLVVTVHDTIPIDRPELFGRLNRHLSRRNLHRQVRSAQKVIAVSHYTKERTVHLTDCDPDKVVVVPNGAGLAAAKKSAAQTSGALPTGISGRFVFYIGNIEPRKNLVNAFAALRSLGKEYDDVQFVVAGRKNFQADQILNEGRGLLGGRLVYLGPVSEDLKWRLYSSASAFVYPSIYEGFGIPILEAYSAGCPAVFSDSSAMTELSFDKNQLFDPSSVDAIRDRLEWVLVENQQENAGLGRKFVERMTWADCYNKTESVYLSVVGPKW